MLLDVVEHSDQLWMEDLESCSLLLVAPRIANRDDDGTQLIVVATHNRRSVDRLLLLLLVLVNVSESVEKATTN